MKLMIATGNANKYKAAQEYLLKFGIETEQAKLELTELQGEEIAPIAIDKANQAFAQLQKPVAVTDAGWQIPALKGFPGPYMHSIIEWFEVDDFLSLMKNKTDRTIIMNNVAVYKDEKQVKIFNRVLTGKILDKPQGEGLSVDRIATFRKDELTIAQCHALNFPSSDDSSNNPSQWVQLGQWIKESTAQS